MTVRIGVDVRPLHPAWDHSIRSGLTALIRCADSRIFAMF